MERPVLGVAASPYTDESKQANLPERIGLYPVLAPIGAGGMGEVYLANDTRLGRKVALKLLRMRFTTDGEMVRRFEQEARAASALNHPKILTLAVP